ncbi:unnamed protein product, partial [Polarella glacialis]
MWMDPQGNDSGLSDMHTKWAEKGAHEFVPVSLSGFSGSAPVSSQQGPPGPGFRGMGQSGMGGWGGGPGMGMAAGNWGGMGAEAPWGMPGQQMGQSGFVGMGASGPSGAPVLKSLAAAPVPAKSNTLVVVWNLSPDYKPKELKHDLAEIDFTTERCQDILEGSFLLRFAEVWHANALVVSLDGTNECLRTALADQPIRMATYSVEAGKWSAE